MQRCKSERSSCAKVQKWDTALKGRSETGWLTGGFSGLREDGQESLLTTQWGLVRTVVSSDGLPERDRTSLASLAPQAPKSPQRSEPRGYFADASSMIPGMESSQHVGQLQVGVSMGRFEADF